MDKYEELDPWPYEDEEEGLGLELRFLRDDEECDQEDDEDG